MTPEPIHPQVTGQAIRRIVLEQAKRAGVGHIGSALSVADILAALFDGSLDSPAAPRARDRFVLSKGHAALALYACLFLRGRIDRETLSTYCVDGGRLPVHPEKDLPGVDFSSGSLGQGLSLGAGAALAMRLKGQGTRARVLLSDAELNEGSTWEAAMFAAHHKLGNLDAIVDLNGQQAMGPTREVIDLSPLAPRWRAFGWDVREADGHDPVALRASLDPATAGDKPRIVLARTLSGKGVGFMEGQVKWHYWPLSDAEYATALAELGTP